MNQGKKQMKMNKAQTAAVNSSINTVVSAGAGSGKTTVLSERFTRLVVEKNYGVDEILTLTFTKKATVEMSSRIYKVLKEKAPEKAADFYKANIKTLDSYCNSVAKMGAHLYGISPDFVQDATIEDQIQQMAFPFILEHRENEGLKQLISTKSLEEIATELFVSPVTKFSSVVDPIDYDKCIEIQVDQIVKAWEKYSVISEELIAGINREYEELKGKSKGKFIKETMKNFFEQTTVPECPELTEERVNQSDYEEFVGYTNWVYSLAHLPQTAGADLACIKDYLNQLRKIAEILMSIVNYVYGYPVVLKLLPLLKEFQIKANELKRTSGRLTFKDIASLATCTLRDYPQLRQIEKEKYKAIMIDEFQDNNIDQRNMLFMLAEKLEINRKGIPAVSQLCPDKLFFVGDEKQSIYKFRGADVSVFRGLADDFKDGNLSMSANHRSSPALIACFNTIFGGIPYPGKNSQVQMHIPSVFFTEADEKKQKIPSYEPVYHKVTMADSVQEEINKLDDVSEVYAPKIHFAFYDVSQNQSAEKLQLIEQEAEFQWVARKIKELISEETKGTESIKPSDIAILVRNTSCQPLLERTLLSFEIPYNAETPTDFFGDGPVNDIFSFLRICIYPNDSFSYAQILRSPFVNLSIEETNAVLIGNIIPFEYEPENTLAKDSKERYLHAKKFFLKLQQLCHVEPITTLISRLWYETGYRYETMWNQTVKLYGKTYDIIFEMARKAEENNMSLAAFVDSIRKYQNPTEKIDGIDVPMESVDGVHILTVHKSKGLEYPVVFIVNSQGQTKKDANSSPIYVSRDYGITINTPPYQGFLKKNYFYEIAKDEEELKLSAELRRLVYVAITRAKNEVYITNGKFKSDEKDRDNSPGCVVDSIYQILEPVIKYYSNPEYQGPNPFTFESITPYNRSSETDFRDRKNNEESKIQMIQEIKNEDLYNENRWIVTDVVESKYISPSHLHKADDETVSNYSVPNDINNQIPFYELNEIVESSIPKSQRDLPNPTPRFSFTDFGTITHNYMEATINQEAVKIPSKNLLGLENNQKKIDKVMWICEKMKNMFILTELGKAAINSKFHKAEYDFRSKVGNKIIRGQIDLLFQHENGTYYIVDYKTNSQIDPEIYYNQLACYRQAVSQMIGIQDASEIKCFLFYLRYGKAVDISEECSKVDIEKMIDCI